MKHVTSLRSGCTTSVSAFVVSAALIVLNPLIGIAQPSTNDQPLAQQIEQLRSQVAQLEATLDRQRQSNPMGSATPVAGQQPMAGSQMSGMESEPGCCMGMDMHKGEMGMPPDGMKMPQAMMMDNMGRMGGMGGTSGGSPSGTMPGMASGGMPAAPGMNMGGAQTTAPSAPRSMSSLPGMPGASHLYHIGSTGFFLDQPQITLTDQQQSTLNGIKERVLLERSNADRRVQEAEQELWVLTGADQPDAGRIQAKAREIEQIRTAQRLAFITAVGEATRVLTDEQRAQLLGMSNVQEHE